MKKRQPTRRAVVGGLASMSSTLSIPGFMRSAIALPSNGVRFVEAGTEEAEQLSYQYNLSYAVEPHLRAMCSTTQGVVETVRWAREKDVRFAIRSGGHCFGATSSHPDLVIDLRELYGVSLDPTSRRLTAQPGAWLASLYRAGFAHSLAPSAGWCGDVGLGGHILGGGLGYLARANGLLCDHLKSATMVTADGSLLTCSAVENPDVFWACRGGGGGWAYSLVSRLSFNRLAPRILCVFKRLPRQIMRQRSPNGGCNGVAKQAAQPLASCS